MHDDPYHAALLRSSSADLRLGKLTSIDLLENALDRIADVDRKLESFVCLADGCPRPGCGGRSRNRSGPVARTSARRASGGQGQLPHRATCRAAPVPMPPACISPGRIRSRREAARSRRDHRRQDADARIRMGQRNAALEEPLGSEPRSRRLERRIGRGRRRADRACGDRFGHWRIDPHPSQPCAARSG